MRERYVIQDKENFTMFVSRLTNKKRRLFSKNKAPERLNDYTIK